MERDKKPHSKKRDLDTNTIENPDGSKKKMPINEKIKFISQIYENSQNMIKLADTKANISLSVQCLLISIGLGTSILTNSFEKLQKLNDVGIIYVYYFIVLFFTISTVTGVILTILVYKARLLLDKTEQKRDGLIYFGDITHFATYEDYFLSVTRINEDNILNEFTQQIYYLSHIIEKKMKYVNISIYFLVFNMCLTIILVILTGYIDTL